MIDTNKFEKLEKEEMEEAAGGTSMKIMWHCQNPGCYYNSATFYSWDWNVKDCPNGCGVGVSDCGTCWG